MLPRPVPTIGPLAEYLAQTSNVQRSMNQVLFWGAVLMAAALLLGGGVVALRRRAVSREDESPQIFSLGELRRMRDSGEITEEEFESLRTRVIAHLGGTGDVGGAEEAARKVRRDR